MGHSFTRCYTYVKDLCLSTFITSIFLYPFYIMMFTCYFHNFTFLISCILVGFRYFGFITKHPDEHRFACHVFMSKYSTDPVAQAVG